MKTNWIRELFIFSKKERSGIVSLLLIIFILIVIGKLIPRFVPSETTDISKWEAEVNSFLENSKKQIPEEGSLRLVAFNPNEVDSIRLVDMGIPPKVAANWLKYLEKGGRFKDKEGIKKIFGVTTDLYEQLDSFIVIPQARNSVNSDRNVIIVKSENNHKRDTFFKSTFTENKRALVNSLELNSADSLHLLEIPGIGPVLLPELSVIGRY